MVTKELALSTSDLLEEYAPDKWLTPDEVSEKFGVVLPTIRRWRDAGRFIVRGSDGLERPVRMFKTLGNHARYNAEDIELLLEQNEDFD